MKCLSLFALITLSFLAVAPQPGAAQPSAVHPVPPVSNPCPRPAAGTVVGNPHPFSAPMAFWRFGSLTSIDSTSQTGNSSVS